MNASTDSVVRLDPSDPRATVCLTCGAAWDDSVSTSLTPVPAGRCPFEADHTAADIKHLFTPCVWIHDNGRVTVDFCDSYSYSFDDVSGLDDSDLDISAEQVDAASAFLDDIIPVDSPFYVNGEMSHGAASAFLRALADHIDAHPPVS
jgi:hypothetical protein